MDSETPKLNPNLSRADQVQALRQQIEDLKRCWPAHSTPAAMLQRLEDLEDALASALKTDES